MVIAVATPIARYHHRTHLAGVNALDPQRVRMKYWLLKTEPQAYSIDDLERDGRTCWDGVRNYQARNFMRDMKVSDLALFYHSGTEPIGVTGIARVAREAYPDHTAWDPDNMHFDPKSTPDKPSWMMVDIAFVEKFPKIVSLDTLKTTEGLEGMPVIQRGQRLSVQPVDEKHFRIVKRLATGK